MNGQHRPVRRDLCLRPGLDPASLDVQLDKGVLTTPASAPACCRPRRLATVHIDERFIGRFPVDLPGRSDPKRRQCPASTDGAVCRVQRLAAAQPRRPNVV